MRNTPSDAANFYAELDLLNEHLQQIRLVEERIQAQIRDTIRAHNDNTLKKQTQNKGKAGVAQRALGN